MSHCSLDMIGVFRAFVFSSQFLLLRLCLCSSVQLCSPPRAELQPPTAGTREEQGSAHPGWVQGAKPLLLRLCPPALAPVSTVGLPLRSSGELLEMAVLREMGASAGACKG